MTDQTTHQPQEGSTSGKSWLRLISRYWPGLVVLIVILLLIGLYQFTIKQFTSQVTTDFVQHQKDSPNVHKIVHVRQKLLVGVDSNNQPFSFKPAGELIGFDIDLGRAIAREFNVPVEFIEYDFVPSLSAEGLGSSNPLTEDKVDIVISGLTVNRMRQQYYSFTKPYLSAGLVAITQANNQDIKNSTELEGKKIGVIEFMPSIDLAKSLTSNDQVSTFKSKELAITAINEGQIDALIVEAPVAQIITKNNPTLKLATDLLTNDDYAVMVMRGEDDLVSDLNGIINVLRQKGVLESLRHKWLD